MITFFPRRSSPRPIMVGPNGETGKAFDQWLDGERAKQDRVMYAKPGTTVVFAHPQNGDVCDQELACMYLRGGRRYTVKRTQVFSSSSVIELREFPGVEFNTVLFEAV